MVPITIHCINSSDYQISKICCHYRLSGMGTKKLYLSSNTRSNSQVIVKTIGVCMPEVLPGKSLAFWLFVLELMFD